MQQFTTVVDFLANLADERRAEANELRQIITSQFPELTEHIKWNSPSYILNGDDRLTFNLHNPDQTMLLLHMGATRKEDKKGEPILHDTTGLITWNSDIRGTLSFSSVDEIKEKKEAIIQVLRDWLSLT